MLRNSTVSRNRGDVEQKKIVSAVATGHLSGASFGLTPLIGSGTVCLTRELSEHSHAKPCHR
jgi:hypothetical protein